MSRPRKVVQTLKNRGRERKTTVHHEEGNCAWRSIAKLLGRGEEEKVRVDLRPEPEGANIVQSKSRKTLTRHFVKDTEAVTAVSGAGFNYPEEDRGRDVPGALREGSGSSEAVRFVTRSEASCTCGNVR